MLKKFGYDRKATDNESSGKLGECPQSHRDHVVAYIGGFGDFPSVVCSIDRRYASAGARSVSTTRTLVDTAKAHVAAT